MKTVKVETSKTEDGRVRWTIWIDDHDMGGGTDKDEADALRFASHFVRGLLYEEVR